MKTKDYKKLIVGVLFLSFFFACQKQDILPEGNTQGIEESTRLTTTNSTNGILVVANRSAGTFSLFNAQDGKKIRNIKLPNPMAEPTYVVHNSMLKELYVADFANKAVWIYNSRSFSPKGKLNVGEGAFHMWLNKEKQQLWVNNIQSKTTSVVLLRTRRILKTLRLPKSLQDKAEQHDVVISEDGNVAYVTVLLGSTKSLIFAYDTSSLKVIRKVSVGGDAHLFTKGNRVYVPVQNSDRLVEFDLRLNRKRTIRIPSAHGITGNSKFLYVTGIENRKVFVVNRSSFKVINVLKTNFDTPHNVVVNLHGNRLLVSYSGTNSNSVTIHNLKDGIFSGKPISGISGSNPFGVAFVSSPK